MESDMERTKLILCCCTETHHRDLMLTKCFQLTIENNLKSLPAILPSNSCYFKLNRLPFLFRVPIFYPIKLQRVVGIMERKQRLKVINVQPKPRSPNPLLLPFIQLYLMEIKSCSSNPPSLSQASVSLLIFKWLYCHTNTCNHINLNN